MSQKQTDKTHEVEIVVFVQLQRIYLILPLITWLRGRKEMHYKFICTHYAYLGSKL